MPGKWLTIEAAFQRACEIEGVTEVAFERLVYCLTEGKIDACAFRRERVSGRDKEKQNWFVINIDFWKFFEFNNEFMPFAIEEKVFVADDVLFIFGELFNLSEWQIVVGTTSLEKALAAEVEPASAPELKTGPSDRKGSGGRPTKYSWPEAAAKLASYVADNDYPVQQSTLVDELEGWFGAQKLKPDRRDLERFVETMYSYAGRKT